MWSKFNSWFRKMVQISFAARQEELKWFDTNNWQQDDQYDGVTEKRTAEFAKIHSGKLKVLDDIQKHCILEPISDSR